MVSFMQLHYGFNVNTTKLNLKKNPNLIFSFSCTLEIITVYILSITFLIEDDNTYAGVHNGQNARKWVDSLFIVSISNSLYYEFNITLQYYMFMVDKCGFTLVPDCHNWGKLFVLY